MVSESNRYTGEFKIISRDGVKCAQMRLTNHAVVMAPQSEQGISPFDHFQMEERFGASASAVRFNVLNDIRGITEQDADVIVDAWEALKADL